MKDIQIIKNPGKDSTTITVVPKTKLAKRIFKKQSVPDGFTEKADLIQTIFAWCVSHNLSVDSEIPITISPKKVAKLVTVSICTRVIVSWNASEKEIMEAAMPRLVVSLKESGICDNIKSIEDDAECPFGSFAEDEKPKRMHRLGERNYALISDAIKTEGTFDPVVISYLFIEHLYVNEANDVVQFLEWVFANSKTFGSDNYEEVYNEWKTQL